MHSCNASFKRDLLNPPFHQLAQRQDAKGNDFVIENLKFFLKHATKHSDKLKLTYRITVNGEFPDALRLVKKYNLCSSSKYNIEILERENKGFDFGAHYAMLKSEAERLDVHNPLNLPYDAYIFLNDGVRGPFVPTYMPENWHWVEGFLAKLHGPVQLVGTSLACLEQDDEAVVNHGMVGPKVESFAFAITSRALRYDIKHGTSFTSLHQDKYNAIIRGEYNLSYNILNSPNNWSITSMLLQHKDLDFRDKKNWGCNNNTHPSRMGSYMGGLSIPPFEVIFHKAWWRTTTDHPDVSAKEMLAYARIMDANTKGVGGQGLFCDT
eukprot:1392753-Amorphochlora_amoeboformis.AAC.3